jgi:hypothetical protein
MGRTKKIKDKSQVNGAVAAPKSVFDILGQNHSTYKEKTLEEYRESLNKMTITQLQNHAIAVAQILPNVIDKKHLIDKLEKEFLKKQNQFIAKVDNSNELSAQDKQNILKILNRI